MILPSGWGWIVFHLPSARTVLHLWFVYSADVQTMLELQRQTTDKFIPNTINLAIVGYCYFWMLATAEIGLQQKTT
jgi:hypothetical protein